ncbi:MAG: nickel pincer cofactor biosynthesis protein LarB [Actinomycetaceae bacterium]|nr:nickel pincer cofactor biosynthesis protein LarB [Actinomycetaceae bacterium]
MVDACLDFDRRSRRGYPEAVYCEGKTADQCRQIARLWRDRAGSEDLGTALFTKADSHRAAAIREVLPDAAYDAQAQLVAWPAIPPEPTGGLVVVVCAGTSDIPIAREAALTARYLGRQVTEIVDVGVAGIDRILAHREILRSGSVIVVVAGMEGALASVVAGLVSCPVVGVPTSVGYGVAFDGLTATLSMLNSCAPGVSVVNIDNGYGAGHLAAQIAAPCAHELNAHHEGDRQTREVFHA